MYPLMSLQMALITEWFITHVTVKWPLTTMYARMSLQITLVTECLITHTAAILALLLKVSESTL
jgi:hypothetical protein